MMNPGDQGQQLLQLQQAALFQHHHQQQLQQRLISANVAAAALGAGGNHYLQVTHIASVIALTRFSSTRTPLMCTPQWRGVWPEPRLGHRLWARICCVDS